MNFRRDAKNIKLGVHDLSKGSDDRILKYHEHA
jgi:hypothetical protein